MNDGCSRGPDEPAKVEVRTEALKKQKKGCLSGCEERRMWFQSASKPIGVGEKLVIGPVAAEFGSCQ